MISGGSRHAIGNNRGRYPMPNSTDRHTPTAQSSGTVKYVGFYDSGQQGSERRSYCLAATNKMDYVCDALAQAGHEVQIVSPSWAVEHRAIFYRARTTAIGDGKVLTLGPTFGSRHKLLRGMSYLFSLLWLAVWLLTHVRTGETVLVYHTPYLSWPVRLVKRLKRCRIVLEVEEVYQDVTALPRLMVRWEDALLAKADSFILSTDLLVERLQIDDAVTPFVVLYGAYAIPPTLATPEHDGLIHLVYAGTIDLERNDAFRAVEAASYLTGGYMMHIIGFGQADAVEALVARCREISENGMGCPVRYEGVRTGTEYVRYMQHCHIGLCPRATGAAYLHSSFPSKVLSYLSLGLRVISSQNRAIERSRIADRITFYATDDPAQIAAAVHSIDPNDGFSAASAIHALHAEFVRDLARLLAT